MASALANIPAQSDMLCEDCGYVLNGLPPGTNCPECGNPTERSSVADRGPSAWEKDGGIRGFLSTTSDVMFHPTRFYRTLATRRGRAGSFWFGQIHWAIACLLAAYAVQVHAEKFVYLSPSSRLRDFVDIPFLGTIIIALLAMLTLEGTTILAARLTTWEASYRGLRLPVNAVLRGLDFHAAHYIPIAVVAFITMVGYHWLNDHRLLDRWLDRADTIYIYTLCGEVVLGAGYLFKTYWIGMRNMMYANA